MEPNGDAPAYAVSEIEIAAEPERVWEVLADFERWPSWNPDVASLSIDGPVAPGTEFRWKSGPATIRSRLERVEPPQLIGWSGRTLGLSAKHVFRLERIDGGTRVRTEESFDGWLATLLRRRMQGMLQEALDGGLHHLKAEVEREER